MARLIFPDEGSRLAYDPGTGRLLAAGTKVLLYLDAAATQPATDLLNADLSANTTGFVTLDAYRRLPIFSGPTSGADTLYAVISGGPVTPVYARTDDRLDGLAARVTTLEAGGSGTAVQSVNGHTGTAVTVTKADVGLGNADNTADTAKPVSTAQQTALNAKADLVAGVVPTAQLPALAITDTFPVASQAAMLALTAQRGDVAIRSDLGKSFVLAADDPLVLANWLELPAAGKVTSVNGQQGVVVLAAGDVGADASGAASAAQAAAIAAAATDATTKANAAQAASAQKLVRTAVKTANYTAAAGDLVPCDTTSAAFTVTLPTAPAAGSRVAVKIVTLGSGHFVTIACGGSDVFNKTAGATTATLQLLGHAMNLQYDTGGIWTVVADDVPKSQLDATYVTGLFEVAGVYQTLGGRLFVGPDDPSGLGFTLTDDDLWYDTDAVAASGAAIAVGQSVQLNALAQQSAWGGGGTSSAPTPLISTTSPLGIVRRFSAAPASLGAFMEFVFALTAGTYQPVLAMSTGPDRGIFKLRIGTTDVATGLDGYTASATGVMFAGISTYVVAADGNVTVRLEVTGKNASSTAFQVALSALSLTRTA